MRNTYPIIMSPTNEGYVVSIPDFGIMTQGSDLTDAIAMARDAIGLMGIDMEDDKKALPVPSSIDKIVCSNDDIKTLVDVDFTDYRRRNNIAVKKNCTISS